MAGGDPPGLATISPSNVTIGSTVDMTITGAGQQDGVTVPAKGVFKTVYPCLG